MVALLYALCVWRVEDGSLISFAVGCPVLRASAESFSSRSEMGKAMRPVSGVLFMAMFVVMIVAGNSCRERELPLSAFKKGEPLRLSFGQALDEAAMPGRIGTSRVALFM